MKKLLDKMTIEEKLGQLVQIPPFFYIKDLKDELYGPAVELGLTKEEIFKTGSVLGIASPEEMIQVQTEYLKHNRLKIPLMFMADIIHGYETIFPIPLALAGTFNKKLVRKASEIAAKEAQSSGIHITFSPMGDISRDPRWGRVMESFGEDPHLNYTMSYEMVKGYQGDDIKKEGNLASCFKHFAGYGLSEAGRDYNTVDLSEYNLKQNFSAGYLGAIKADAKMAMTSFNIFEGIPATMNKKLIKKILREDFKFDGVVISDYNGVRETIVHGISEDDKQAAINSFNAGLDIEMVSATYMNELKEEFETGRLDIKELDKAVLRVLNLKKELGLFEDPFKGASRDKHDEYVLSKENLDYALKVANESICLLKNNQVLPLEKGTKVSLFGPNKNERDLNGAWSWHGSRENKTLEEKLKEEGLLTDVENSNYILYFGGEKSNESGEAKSKANIDFDYKQLEEIKQLKKYNKPIILINSSGRPNILTEVEKEVDAILQTWFLGTRFQDSIYETLYGINNPSAKLPMTFPRSLGQVPIYYNHLQTGRPYEKRTDEYVSYYIDESNKPLYPFGYGLAYSEFEIGDIEISQKEFSGNEEIKVGVNIKNKSNKAGFEVLQLYIRDLYAKVSRPLLELKDYKKIYLNPNETKYVEFTVNKEMLKYYDQELNYDVDSGEFIIYVGNSSNNLKDINVKYLKGNEND